MKLNRKLLAQLRATTRSLWGTGPGGGAIVRQALKQANAMERQMRQFAAPSRSAPATKQASHASPHSAPNSPSPHSPPSFVPPFSHSAHDAAAGRFINGSHANDAGRRDYKLYVPGSHVGLPAPLLVMLHGCGQDPDDFAKGTGMNALAEETGCLVLYPAQSASANPSRCWNWFNAMDQRRGQGEPSIIADMTLSVMERHAIDPNQVYVAGLSAGGAMATIMGTLYPDLYAAVGVHSGLPFASAHDLPSALAAMKGDFRRGQASGRALPMIVFHGDRDTTVHPANGDELVRHLAQPGMAEPGRVPDGHAYTRTLYPDDDGHVHAEHWLVHGAGHAWFGGNARGSYTDGRGPDASREMMRFFRTRR